MRVSSLFRRRGVERELDGEPGVSPENVTPGTLYSLTRAGRNQLLVNWVRLLAAVNLVAQEV
jgi:hypothetical protein